MKDEDSGPRHGERRTIRRRSLLKAGVLSFTAAAVGGAAYEAWRTWQALHPHPFPYEAQSAATATAAASEGLTTTLVPVGQFTSEMIQEVLNNIGIVILELTNGQRIIRSAWLAQGPGNGYNIVTSLHEASNGSSLSDGRSIKNVLFGRPHIDQSFVEADARKCKIASGGSKEVPQDVALITIPRENFNFKTDTPPEGTHFIDGYPPRINSLILFAGYPNLFKNSSNLLLSTSDGGQAPVISVNSAYEWGIKGLVSLGSSGEPVFAVVNGQLTGIGVVSGSDLYYEVGLVSSLPLNKLRSSAS
jgi:hypothetical protein